MTKEEILKLKPNEFLELAHKVRLKKGEKSFNEMIKFYLYNRSWQSKENKLENNVKEIFN